MRILVFQSCDQSMKEDKEKNHFMFSKCLVNQALLSINILLSRISYYVYCKNVLYTLSSTKLCFFHFSLFISSDEEIHLFILYHKQQRSQRQTLHTKLIILIPRKDK